MAWTTPRTWVAGELVTAALLNAHLRDNLNALTTWQSYTPTWVNVSLGNGSLVGKYISAGKLVLFKIDAVWGTTTSSTSTWTFSLPVTLNGVSGSGQILCIGAARDSSAGSDYGIRGKATTTTTLTPVQDVSFNVISNAVPFTWASGDDIHLYGSYEAA
jgi:hypothetical protein